MTTKKFQVRTNLQGLEDVTFTCDNRADAIAYITNTLMGNSQINPQDLILEEVEVVDEEAVVMDIANKIAEGMKMFALNLEVKPYSGLVELHESKYQFPSLSRPVVQHIFELIDKFNAGLEGYEVLMSITHECAIRLILSKKENE